MDGGVIEPTPPGSSQPGTSKGGEGGIHAQRPPACELLSCGEHLLIGGKIGHALEDQDR